MGVSRSNTLQTTVADSESMRVIVPAFPANGPPMIRAWSPSWSDVGIAISMPSQGASERRLVGADVGLAGLLRRGPDDIIMKAWQTYLYGISPTMFTRSFSAKQNRGGSHFSSIFRAS